MRRKVFCSSSPGLSFDKKVDCGSCGRFLQHFTDRHLPAQAKQLHSRLVLCSITPGNYLASQLINFYGKISNPDAAYNVFDRIPVRNTFSYNSMFMAYSLSNCHREVLNLFPSLAYSKSAEVKPDNYSIICLLRSLSSVFVCDVKLSKVVHGFSVRHVIVGDAFVMNTLVAYYSKCNDLASARRVFDNMPTRDVVSWNSMISGYSHNGFYEECKSLFRKMVDCSGLKPNEVTLLSVLQACGQSQDAGFGMEAHRFLISNHVNMDLPLSNALVAMYAKCGNLDISERLFQEMKHKDEITYGSLISGYMLHGLVDRGMDLFMEMENPGLNIWNTVITGLAHNNQHGMVLDLFRQNLGVGFWPSPVTLSSVLRTLSSIANLRAGKEVHAYAVRTHHDKNLYVTTAIIDAYAKSGFLRGARRVFDRSKCRNLIVWTAMISAHAAHGDADSAFILFDEMRNSGIDLDSVTFTALLAVCAHSGMVDRASSLFDSMLAKHGVRPSMEHYACMASVLSKAGRVSEALEFLSRMPTPPNAKAWGALLNGASVSGDVELWTIVCHKLFELEPENVGNHVFLANLYSQAGRWEEAQTARETMNLVGWKKTAGCSLMETTHPSSNQLQLNVI